MKLDYCFSHADAQRAVDEWGCNCGPSALAFALRRQLDAVRTLIPGFDEKRYTSPTMMAAALSTTPRDWGWSRLAGVRRKHPMFSEDRATLTRVQWTGPWTAPGSNPRWAYRQTHWVCSWLSDGQEMVFDINAGIVVRAHWESVTIPAILSSCVPRADGGWYPTHCWQVWNQRSEA